jgi:hypothetical protein
MCINIMDCPVWKKQRGKQLWAAPCQKFTIEVTELTNEIKGLSARGNEPGISFMAVFPTPVSFFNIQLLKN